MKTTKKKRIEMAREIIDRNVLDIPFPDFDLIEFSEVLQGDILGAVRKINPQFPSDIRHLHMLIDDTWESKSWRKMINALTPLQEVKRVMRFVAWEDMQDFFSVVEPKECQSCLSVNDLTVDHVDPPFDNIANDFISKYGLPKIEKSKNTNQVVNVFSDTDLESRWIVFHSSHSVYQVLCRSCNARKGKRPC